MKLHTGPPLPQGQDCPPAPPGQRLEKDEAPGPEAASSSPARLTSRSQNLGRVETLAT